MSAKCLQILAAILCAASVSAQADWQADIRRLVHQQQVSAALAVAERRLAEVPQDLEARGWRARLLAWSDRVAESEAEYRAVLTLAPRDTDILVGLADVLARQQRFSEALVYLDRARELEPSRDDVEVRRGRMLRALGRRDEARSAFRAALAQNPNDPEARAGLDSVAPEPRHQLVAAGDFDFFHTATNSSAQLYTLTLRSDWPTRWRTLVGTSFGQRFGETPARGLGSVTLRLTPAAAFTVGGVGGRDQGVVAKAEVFWEYGHGWKVSRERFLRGVEATFAQRWLWFDGARVLTLAPTAFFYLPRDWIWSVQVTAARSRFTGTPTEWRPSGVTRFAFPVHRRVTGNAFFAVGTENFAVADQLGRFSARTWGGGARWQFASRQDVSFYAFYQDRSQGRTQTSFGLAYGIRF
jgi:tetratricopeptide (TPR) repeat protein